MLLMTCTVNAQAKRKSTGVKKPQTTVRKSTSRTTAKTASVGKKSATNFCPDNNHPHAIDLGLSSGTKWSCCNVDAKIPEECGGYYALGEVKEKKVYNKENYRHYDHYLINFYGSENDVAHVKWGEDWIIPTSRQFQELFDECTYEWASFNGVNGGIFIGPNGNTIFLPAAGWKYREEPSYVNTTGCYSSSTSAGSAQYYCWHFIFNESSTRSFREDCTKGFSIRPVEK